MRRYEGRHAQIPEAEEETEDKEKRERLMRSLFVWRKTMAGSKGGRGGKAGSNSLATNKAATITFPDGTFFRYIEAGNKIYDIAGEVPREVNTTLKLSDITQNAESMGATVEKLSDDDMKEIERLRAARHTEWDKILSRAELGLKRYFVSRTRATRGGR